MLDVNKFDSMCIKLASPEKIREWSKGEVKKPETINYRTLKPEKDGLFCEKIFGPTRDWECHCGKYKRVRYKGIVCERCGVEVTKSKVRRERMGHIELAAPVSHIWYFKGIPSRMGIILDVSPKSLEKVLYFAAYIVLADVVVNNKVEVEKGTILSVAEYKEKLNAYGPKLDAMMGAEAVKKLLLDMEAEDPEHEGQTKLETLRDTLRNSLATESGAKRAKAIRRLEVVEAFLKSGNKPSWMILDVIPVIPPDLRPMVQLDGGRFATSDLNDLYRRVINRNNRLKRLLELGSPEMIVNNEKRMLQDAVDALIDNGRHGRPVTGPANRPLKSLSDMLKGKQGRFRQNLLGKRVDYSGRSVIVVGPELKLHQCGLPTEMALELFKPFVMKKLVSSEKATNIKAAKRMVERANSQVWDILEEVIKEHPVLLNRAPTLHRLGIQAFEPVLTQGRALKLHPLACTAYNADFDGDQMAIHLPLSSEAQAEARILMLAANHILAPKDGKPIIVPTQDMVLGSYYLTIIRPGAKGEYEEGKFKGIYTGISEALMAYQHGNLDLQAQIYSRVDDPEKGLVKTSLGRMIFNEILPKEIRYYNLNQDADKDMAKWTLGVVMDKKQLGKLVAKCFKTFGAGQTAVVIDNVKNLGYHYACIAGMTVAVSDVKVPKEKPDIIAAAKKKEAEITKYFNRGLMTDNERYEKVVATWEQATNDVGAVMMKCMDVFNPIRMMADSGARGNEKQMRQLAGMRGLMADPSGKTIELPITANFREGLSVSDYFISSHGARKGLADTALRTADSGYLTRRLVDVAQDVIVREEDCDIVGINMLRERAKIAKSTAEAIEYLRPLLLGRVLAKPVIAPETGEILLEQNNVLQEYDLGYFAECNVPEITIKGSLDFSEAIVSSAVVSEEVSLGEADETARAAVEAKLIQEMLGKQLIEDVVDSEGTTIVAALDEAAGDNVQLNEELIKKILACDTKEIKVRNNTVRGIEVEAIKQGSGIIESLEDRIVGRVLAEDIFDAEGNKIASLNDNVDEDLAKKICQVTDKVSIRSVLTCKSQFGVCVKCYGRDLANATEVDIGEAVGIIAAQSIGEPGTQLTMRTFHTGGVAGDDITQGLPRVEELFEARKPKHNAIISEIDGKVSIEDNQGMIKVTVSTGKGKSALYNVPYGARIPVKDGDIIKAGDKITEGSISPHDILRVCGLRDTQRYLVYEVQKVYKSQGVEINDKHIEVMVRQMLHKVKIIDQGNTHFLPGEDVDINTFESVNAKAIENGKEPAAAKPILLGITKASLATDSFLSAASFQETTRVLTEAAIKGKIDPLIGLKENVIIGKLIPAGTGMGRYRDIEVVDTEAELAAQAEADEAEVEAAEVTTEE